MQQELILVNNVQENEYQCTLDLNKPFEDQFLPRHPSISFDIESSDSENATSMIAPPIHQASLTLV